MRAGVPTNAVMMPIGISLGWNAIRPITSAQTISIAPSKADTGITDLLVAPTYPEIGRASCRERV